VPPIFDLIKSAGSISDSEMQHVFNLGVGMIVVAHEEDADSVMSMLAEHNPFHVGAVVAS
jgi:phosphoribosylformylglycinamidine cyclo-ligase